MKSNPLVATLSEIGINVSVEGEHLRLTGNLQALTDDMKSDLQREKRTIMEALSSPYPNTEGCGKCCYCLSWQAKRCGKGHEVDGSALLRTCDDFKFDQAAYDAFYSQSL